MADAKKSRYHHGNLKQDLLEAAFQALERESLDKLSLRSLAKTLGVTPAAVYGHFSDKVALLVELRTQGFEKKAAFLAAALEALPETATPEDKLRALGKAYMTFALDHPNLFDTLFSWSPEYERLTEESVQAGACGVEILRGVIVELLEQEAGELNEYQITIGSFSAWALVHGISTLLRTGAIEGLVHCERWPETFSAQHPRSLQAQAIDQLLTVEIAGLKAAAKDF